MELDNVFIVTVYYEEDVLARKYFTTTNEVNNFISNTFPYIGDTVYRIEISCISKRETYLAPVKAVRKRK